MSYMNTGGPAFPRPASVAPRVADIEQQDGMTLRDYFAAHALMGMLASRDPKLPRFDPDDVAEYAYSVADAMLKAGES